MSAVGYNHAVVLSPCFYARAFYEDNLTTGSAYWQHEDATRHLCTQLMSRYSSLALYSLHASHRVPDQIWTDPYRINACFFSQASRIILFVPNDGEKQIHGFVSTCLAPLLTLPKEEGGRPDWYSRFLVVAIGNVLTPNQLSPGHPFIKVIRFREISWIRDLSAIMLIYQDIKNFWLPPKSEKPENHRFILTPVHWTGRYESSAGFRLRETLETVSMVNVNTHVAGTVDLDTMSHIDSDLEETKVVQNGCSRGDSSHKSGHSKNSRRSSSRSRSRQSSSSGYRSIDPGFEAEQCQEKQVETRVINCVDPNGRTTLWRFSIPKEVMKEPPEMLQQTIDETDTLKKLLATGESPVPKNDTETIDSRETIKETYSGAYAGKLDQITSRSRQVNSAQTIVEKPSTLRNSCLLDETCRYIHPTDKTEHKDMKVQAEQIYKSFDKDNIQGQLHYLKLVTIERSSNGKSTAVNISHPTTPEKSQPNSQQGHEHINPVLFVEEKISVASSTTNAVQPYPFRVNIASTNKLIDKTVSHNLNSVVVENLTCLPRKRFDTYFLVDTCSNYELQLDRPDTVPLIDRNTCALETSQNDVFIESPTTTSEPILSKTHEPEKIITGPRDSMSAENITSTKKRIIRIIRRQEGSSGPSWKVEQTKTSQVPLETVDNSNSAASLERPAVGKSETVTTVCVDNLQPISDVSPHHIRGKISEIDTDTNVNRHLRISGSPPVSASRGTHEHKQITEGSALSGVTCSSAQHVPIKASANVKAQVKSPLKDVTECYNSYTSMEVESHPVSSYSKRITTRKKTTSTIKATSQCKVLSPEVDCTPPPSHIDTYSCSPDDNYENEEGGVNHIGQRTKSTDEVTLYYHDPFAGHLKPGSSKTVYNIRPVIHDNLDHEKRPAPTNHIIYVKTRLPQGQHNRTKSEDRSFSFISKYARGLRPTVSPGTSNSVRIYRSKGFADPDNLLSDATTQIYSPLVTGHVEISGVTCFASTGLHYRRKKTCKTTSNDEPELSNVVLKEQSNWTGPDAAVTFKLELDRAQLVSTVKGSPEQYPEVTSHLSDVKNLLSAVKPPEEELQRDVEQPVNDDISKVPATTATKTSQLRHSQLSLYASLACLAVFLSMIVAYFCLKHTQCNSRMELGAFWRWLSRITGANNCQPEHPGTD